MLDLLGGGSGPLHFSLPQDVHTLLKRNDWKDILSAKLVGEIYQTGDYLTLNQNGISLTKIECLVRTFSGMRSPVVVIRNFNDLKNELEFDWSNLARKLQPMIYWAYRRSAGTYSKYRATLGYHTDNYHIAIIQLEGSRNWKVWDKSVLSDYEVGYMMREDAKENVELAKMPNTQPILDIDLHPGEILWIPALYPHLGVTNSIDNSLSASIVWESYSYLKLAKLISHYNPIPIPTFLLPKLLKRPYETIPLVSVELLEKELQVAFNEIKRDLNLSIDELIISQMIDRIINNNSQKYDHI